MHNRNKKIWQHLHEALESAYKCYGVTQKLHGLCQIKHIEIYIKP